MNGPWSLGALIWPPVCLVLIALLVLPGRIFLRWRRGEIAKAAEYAENPTSRLYAPSTDEGLFLACAIACGVGILALLVGTAIGMYPYSEQYHRWQSVGGTVTSKSSRIMDGGSGVNQRFVVTLSGVGQRSCDDSRCAGIKVGDHLSLSCKRAWQYAATDGWDCNFISLEGKS